MRWIKLGVAADEYIKYLYSTRAKDRKTIEKEDRALQRWVESFRDLKISRLTLADIREYVAERAEDGVSNRTINLDVLALRNMMEHYRLSMDMPEKIATDYWVPLQHTAPHRALMPGDSLQRLTTACFALNDDGSKRHENGEQMADLLSLLAYTGARISAALSARWDAVDFKNKQITFLTKYAKRVTVDFNPSLEALLTRMKTARDEGEDPQCEWLFPSPARIGHWTAPDNLFTELREDTNLLEITFHDFRHAFISHAIMAGVDTLTVARWVGHADGGVLIGKVYGHLNNQHLKDSAAKLTNL